MAADSSNGPSSFGTQANALLRKNLIFQKRNMKTNIRLVLLPVILCLLLVLIQQSVNNVLDNPGNRCGCRCVDTGNSQCEMRCGVEYSDSNQVFSCPIPHPKEWPPLLQLPYNRVRSVRTDFMSYGDLPDDSCKRTGSCPVTMLITGNNRTFGQSVTENMFGRPSNIDLSDILHSVAGTALGTDTLTSVSNFVDEAFFSTGIDFLQPQCTNNSQFSIPQGLGSSAILGSSTLQQDISCVQGLRLWRNSSSEINDELYRGYRRGNSQGKINEIVAGYDFLNSNENLFNVTIWYNSSYSNTGNQQPDVLTRVPRSVNLVQFFTV